jgi:4-hydroxybenzoate polyprenyltransferase
MLGDLLRLARAPLAATAIADGVTGYLLATVRFAKAQGPYRDAFPHETIRSIRPLIVAAVASAALYCAGMALNDWFDLERDRKLYPFRPLPSGRVAPWVALALGVALLAVGVGCAFLAGGEKALLVAVGTGAAILSYDGVLKRFRLPGCIAMGACRAGNILLGGTIALAQSALGGEGAIALHVPYAIAIGLYVFSLTLLSTFEDEDEKGAGLALGFLGVLSVPVALATLLRATSYGIPFFAGHFGLALVLAATAVRKGTKATGHTTTRWLLRGLLLLDAGAIAGSGLPLLGSAAVLALIVPNVLGAKVLFSRGRPSGAPPTAS